MTKNLLLCGCLFTLACPAFALVPPPPLPHTDAPPPTMDEGELLRKIRALDDERDGSLNADPTNQGKEANGKKGGTESQGPTVIMARDTDFQKGANQAIFTNKVVVNNASFNLVCDKLTAFLAHNKGPKPAAATPAPAAPKSKFPTMGADNDALEKAIAEGSVQITQDKMDDSGNITHSVGHGKKAIYEKATGDITLFGMPDMQQGENLCVATSETTYMVLNRNGKMEAFGPHMTVIKENSPAKPAPGAAPAK